MAKKEQQKAEDLLENSEVIKEKIVGVEHWIESNPKIVLSAVGAIVVVVAAYFGFRYWVDSRNEQAQEEMFQAIHYFEMDSLNLALQGNANVSGFDQIIDDYGMTKAGNLANFYAGAITLKQGKFPLAIHYLKDFSTDDVLIQARAYSLLGDAYMEQNDIQNAADAYHKASTHEPNKFFTPTYLMKEALAYEKLNQNDKAIAAYDKIINEYWESTEFQLAKKLKAKLEPAS